MTKILILLSAILVASTTQASPSPLEIDKKSRPAVAKFKIRAAHRQILHDISIPKLQEKILSTMFATKGMAWYLEEITDEYIKARFDYKGNAMVIRLEYDEKSLQVKYVAGLKDFACKNNENGICYKNHRHYYNYIERLLVTLVKTLNTGESS